MDYGLERGISWRVINLVKELVGGRGDGDDDLKGAEDVKGDEKGRDKGAGGG